ncbi:MAG: hypothetical protein A3B74_02480 [Candidatus Kerfeldbacteria bacterium RIFCSPHIGHO2_02_FULL_42_14]|uniref:Adenylate kinase n=1 Tax=Candidatus Kerfeldbacteria bacterium RIFCSPHIGHO2_02_FULL_42_14 TaxID=1798540 RepID=A0A1G2AUF9_9BACT|nr:MAG: hypothetical protein A3B74_02480 [Candidatus Kerfeldbacteria bacterium RIFCSPHIGHO2_02_FULL_42_14]OGY80410.1 MAG: hypothetical protein A3E60_05100 [Candidatus Kerfeldbacteria bacterium RIFCSPHIGHO2_12_FULL_42_13]OGY83840.1 MAG: hypothetical protein A3I91_04625 [Candidatus Kerfeldbacteria bacterium RIFCSPLOWO2_02_FULL_42_19]OGY85315.1 MAG: hypothetical protein A3G01_03330 [Candidatus Kerfeldbacteria bacterium RIFCSPLOWO2_12_FULL_43_9]
MSDPQVRNIVLIGPQGSGKGTQGHLLAERFGWYHLEVGKMLRSIARENTSLGRKVDEIIHKQGEMVPYELVVQLLRETVQKIAKDQSIIFDGTPRRIPELEPFHAILKANDRELTYVFFFDLSEEASIRRLANRRICENCHKSSIIPHRQREGSAKCESCGGNLIQRADDTPAAIHRRLQWHKERVQPVMDYYTKLGRLIRINADQSVEAVYNDMVARL